MTRGAAEITPAMARELVEQAMRDRRMWLFVTVPAWAGQLVQLKQQCGVTDRRWLGFTIPCGSSLAPHFLVVAVDKRALPAERLAEWFHLNALGRRGADADRFRDGARQIERVDVEVLRNTAVWHFYPPSLGPDAARDLARAFEAWRRKLT